MSNAKRFTTDTDDTLPLLPPDLASRSTSVVSGHSASCDISRGVTVYGDVYRIVQALRAMNVPISKIEFLQNCEWALFVRPGGISVEQSNVLRHDFQVSAGRC
jgi:hypothetical protein